MKIAYILYPEAIVLNKANGIRNQAITWAESLNKICEIDLISPWDAINWSNYDLIHIFGGNQWLGFIPDLKALNSNLIFSPVLDSIENKKKLHFQSKLGLKGYHHPQNVYKHYLRNFKAIFVRSEYELEYFSYCYNIDKSKLYSVPIPFELDTKEIINRHFIKERFCLHISSLYQERKNVKRLIQASKKFRFPLVLAGSTGNAEQRAEIIQEIGDCSWIKLLGYISKEEAFDLYCKASVFALPSINEGVGIVALNAAATGCNIVITSIGGPKEYYNQLAKIVNPFDVNNIGETIVELLNSKNQPNTFLQEYIIKHYSKEAVSEKLYNIYKSICENC